MPGIKVIQAKYKKTKANIKLGRVGKTYEKRVFSSSGNRKVSSKKKSTTRKTSILATLRKLYLPLLRRLFKSKLDKNTKLTAESKKMIRQFVNPIVVRNLLKFMKIDVAGKDIRKLTAGVREKLIASKTVGGFIGTAGLITSSVGKGMITSSVRRGGALVDVIDHNDVSSDNELTSYVSQKKYKANFKGIKTLDELENAKSLKAGELFILHLSNPRDPNSGHWELLMRSGKNSWICFESYGLPLDERISNYIERWGAIRKDNEAPLLEILQNSEDLQSLKADSNQCGMYVLMCLDNIFKSKNYNLNFANFLNSLEPNGGAKNRKKLRDHFVYN